MPAITYQDWSGGLDLRLPLGVQDANKLYRLQNAYVTSGKKLRKRPGLKAAYTGLTGSVGLQAINGTLTVFASNGSLFSPPSGVNLINLEDYNPLGGAVFLTDILYADTFEGFPYVVAQYFGTYNPGPTARYVTRHHYLDTTPGTLITDANCPHGDSVTKAASRVFACADEVVRYCAIGAARDWTTASDAGFLPVGRQQDNRSLCTAVGTFDDALTVFFEQGIQIWDVAEDPSANQIRRRLYALGTEYPHSIAGFYRDLVFMSRHGVRSLSVQESVERIDEADVGIPIDPLTVADLAAHNATDPNEPVRGVWIAQLGQFWLMLNVGGNTRAYVYSFSRSAKLTCWSQYTFPILITAIITLAGKVYVRDANTIYELSDTQHTDAGVTIDVDVQMAFQDAKLPGVEKMFYGSDFVFTGTARVSYLFDPRDTSKETNEQAITTDTRAGGLVGMELTAAAVAPRFRHSANEAFGIDLCTLYFHPLSAQSS